MAMMSPDAKTLALTRLTHDVEPGSETSEFLHAAQLELSTAPSLFRLVFRGQSVHFDDRLACAYAPKGQGRHAETSVAPVSALKVPLGQLAQSKGPVVRLSLP